MPIEQMTIVPVSSLPLQDDETPVYGSYAKMYAALRERGLDVTDPDVIERQTQERIIAGTITINELRRIRGRPPIVGGDVCVRAYAPGAF